MVFLCNYASTAAVFNFQKTFIAVGHAVGATNRIVVRWTDLLAATEQETLHASLHGHHVHVFPEEGCIWKKIDRRRFQDNFIAIQNRAIQAIVEFQGRGIISNTITKHLPAIVPLHFAFVTIKLVVGTTNKLPLSTTDLVAERSSATMLCWNLNYPLTACLTLQMAKGSERIWIHVWRICIHRFLWGIRDVECRENSKK